MPEILGDACVYFNPTDIYEMSNVMAQVLCDASLKNKLKEKGLVRIKKYAPVKVAQNIINVMTLMMKN